MSDTERDANYAAPTVGRILHYVGPGLAHYAALVIGTSDDGRFAARVMKPGTADVEVVIGPDHYDPSGPHARPGTWHWPERV